MSDHPEKTIELTDRQRLFLSEIRDSGAKIMKLAGQNVFFRSDNLKRCTRIANELIKRQAVRQVFEDIWEPV